MRNFGNTGADFVIHYGQVDPPGLGKFGADVGIGHLLIAGEQIRQHAHVAGPLDVILPAHRADADMFPAEITGQQSQAGEAFHHVDRLAELRNAHAPHNRGRRRGGNILTA